MSRSLPRWIRLGLLPLGLVWGLAAEWMRVQADWPAAWVIADFVPGVAFLIAGQVAWERQPGNRTGPLLVAIGFAWYVGTFAASSEPVTGMLAHAFQGYYYALLAWVVLAYPTGGLRDSWARAVVGGWFGLLIARSATRLAVDRPSTSYDLGDQVEVGRYVNDIGLRDAADHLFQAGIAILAVAVLVLIVRRLVTETDLGRRVAAPILLSGVALAVGLVVEFRAVATAGTSTERTAAWDLGQSLIVVTATLIPIAFTYGLVRARLTRGAVADLVVELGEAPERPMLRDVLARALGDPSLEVVYPIPGTARYVDASGNDVELPSAADVDRATTRLEGGAQTLAVLIHDPAIAAQPELVRSVAAAARLALENERLTAEVQTQLEAVRASRARIVAAGDAERRRVERDLHDGAQQRLVTLALQLQLARGQVDGSDPLLATSLDDAGRNLELALAELRELARGLHPAILGEAGIAAAVDSLAQRSPSRITVDVTPDRFRPDVEAAAYYIVAEALTNAARYAQARSVAVRVGRKDDRLTIEVADDGVGGADMARGSGLRGLEDRAAAAGGRFEVVSEPGRGTAIRAEIPCA